MKNISKNQKLMLEKLQSQVSNLEVRWNEDRGVASLIEGNLVPWDKIQSSEMIVKVLLDQYGVLLGPPNIAKKYEITKTRLDRKIGIYRTRAYQVFDNLPVYAATLLVFASKERGIFRVQSSFWRDVKVTAKLRIDETGLQKMLAERLKRNPKASAFEDAWRQTDPDSWSLEHYPFTSHPILYIFPTKDGFHPAYNVLAYQPMIWQGVSGDPTSEVGQEQLIVDAASGEVLIEESTKIGMSYTNQAGDGLSTLQDSNSNYLLRTLQVVKDGSGLFLMLNRLHTPEIRTYDANGNETNLINKLKGDTDLSRDSDGHWDTTTTSCTLNTRQTAQQPQVDGHFYADEAWGFYHDLGWDGFDNGLYGAHCPVRVATHIGMEANAYFDYFTEPLPNSTKNRYYGYLAFYDGYCDGATLKFDFMAGDPIMFGHEYQHAITFFGAAKSNGEPGLLGTSGWPRSIHEGFSDAFGSLRKGVWINPDFFPNGAVRKPATGDGPFQRTACGTTATNYCLPFRRIEFPRSTKTKKGDWYCDHFDDKNNTQTTQCFSADYFRSTLLSHLAFLVGQGGVHQRTNRIGAELIPVKGIGLKRTAEIFHYALTQYFDTLPTNLGENIMIEASRQLLDAARNVPGSSIRSCEYVMMRRALYAVGLYPYDESYNKQAYGGEACMLPWTYSWRFSQPYIGLPPLWWQSPDLFINNNGSAEYNAEVGQENNLFARVRNIGDKDLQNVKVKFYFSPVGTNLPVSIAGWHPCNDQNGADCVLTIPTLLANSMNFTDVNSPPANQACHWYLDPQFVTSDVNHFCLRAVIECTADNHDNDCPNEVQSNIQYSKLTAEKSLKIGFQVSNWEPEAKPLDLKVTHTLPRGFRLTYDGDTSLKQIILKGKQSKTLCFKVVPPKNPPRTLEPPYNGKMSAKLKGRIEGNFVGILSNVRAAKRLTTPLKEQSIELVGQLSGNVKDGERKSSSLFNGDFKGELDLTSRAIRGTCRGNIATIDGRYEIGVQSTLEGHLEPMRVVHFTQIIDGEVVGGVTVQIQLPKIPER